MQKHTTLILVNVYASLILLFCTGINAGVLRAFNNPLNNKAVDLFVLVDEQNAYMNELQHGLVKTALYNLATDLNPSGSTPYFQMLFYGASSSVSTVVPHTTTSAATVKTYLDKKQYTKTQLNPSSLVSALSIVDSQCTSYCRPGIPRVTIVISSLPDALAESSIRLLERNRGMTVIVVGIGFSASITVLNRLASHPSRYYAVPVSTFYELILATPHIASMASDVPFLLNINSQSYIPSITNGIYYTVQLNTVSYTTTNDTVVMFASNCAACTVYGSLSEPNPIVLMQLQVISDTTFF
ncbi:hypothetical protein I4U23_013019 [Adineta vaga]|nr:hypothetical protein I4U23_013019 [Adineta vaga]